MSIAVAIATSACGPIVYIDQVTMKAATSIEAAKTAEAEKYAPYWWTRATEYLHKARERAARADFQGANRFGKLSDDAAKQAVLDAEAARNNPELQPIDATKPMKDGSSAPAIPAKEVP